MEGTRPVTLIEPDGRRVTKVSGPHVRIAAAANPWQAETQVGSWTIRWRVRQVGLENLDHTWNLVDGIH